MGAGMLQVEAADFCFSPLPDCLTGFFSHPVIWHNAENTLFTHEMFPPAAGSDPGDMKPLIEKTH